MDDVEADRGLGLLVRERGRDLTAYAYMLTGEHAAAQDLVQDAIVKVFARTRKGFVPDVAEAYVRRAMLTLYVDGYRRRLTWTGVRRLVIAGKPESSSHEAATADRLDLRSALQALAPQERAVIVLRYYEDLMVPEIADRMALAPGTVKRYLSNALHKLEAVLGPLPDLHEESVPVVPSVTRRPTHDTTRTEGSRP